MKLSLFIILELLAFLISILFFKRLRVSFLKWFPLFLFITIGVEIASQLISKEYRVSTNWLYNLYIGVQVLFFLLFFHVENKNKQFRQIALISLLFYFVFHSCNMLFFQGLMSFNYISYLAGAFLIIINSCLFFMNLFATDDSIVLVRQQFFWVTTATLIFFTGTFFYFLFWYFLVMKSVDSDGSLFRTILNVLNIIFYGGLIAGFLCPKPETK